MSERKKDLMNSLLVKYSIVAAQNSELFVAGM